jgi:hypothetical protein
MDIETKLSELVATLQAIEKDLHTLDGIKKTLDDMDSDLECSTRKGLANVSEQISYCHD